jgi:ribosomal protein S18 acetylase RimI-like enzyme
MEFIKSNGAFESGELIIADDLHLVPNSLADKEEFLLSLYRSTRDDLAAMLAESGVLDSLISMQFRAREQQFRDSFPASKDFVILFEERPVGRVFVDQTDATIYLIDLAIFPESRSLGIGGRVIEYFAARAGRLGLQVLKHSRAKRLYDRLGFSVIAESDLYYEMEMRREE